MKHASAFIALLSAAALAPAAALAKLPPPTPEEKAALEAKKAQEEAQLEREKRALARAQDEVAARYRGNGKGAPATSGGEPSQEQLPKETRVLPGDAGPHGRDEPSAEAHSAPAK